MSELFLPLSYHQVRDCTGGTYRYTFCPCPSSVNSHGTDSWPSLDLVPLSKYAFRLEFLCLISYLGKCECFYHQKMIFWYSSTDACFACSINFVEAWENLTTEKSFTMQQNIFQIFLLKFRMLETILLYSL